jgi:hypothetical protein
MDGGGTWIGSQWHACVSFDSEKSEHVSIMLTKYYRDIYSCYNIIIIVTINSCNFESKTWINDFSLGTSRIYANQIMAFSW